MKDAWRNQPPGARFEPVRLREVQNAIITGVPALKTFANIFFGRAWLKTEICMWGVARGGIELGREIIPLRLSFPSHQSCLILALMQVMGNRTEVVEELAVNRPAAIGIDR